MEQNNNLQTPRLSACVVMYGGADMVNKCLHSVAEHTQAQDFTLYLVDNASPDGALEQLKKSGIPECVDTVPLRTNIGFGAGHNSIMKNLNSKYHAVINPDIVLYDDAISKIADWMDEHPDVAIVTPRLVFPGGQEQNIAKRRPAFLPLVARQLNLGFLKKYEDHYLMLDEDLSAPTDVEFCSGCFFVIRTDIFKQIGGFDEKYFMYVEDADITQKALTCGRALYLPYVTVEHAWQRAAHRRLKQFLWQLRSMGRYFCKWGFKLK